MVKAKSDVLILVSIEQLGRSQGDCGSFWEEEDNLSIDGMMNTQVLPLKRVMGMKVGTWYRPIHD
jgi:hypothetical protein